MKNLLREPLLHFLLLGTLIFASYQLVPSSNVSSTLVVSKQRIDNLSNAFQATWYRQPTDEELNSLIDHYILEELYYREALILGLDQDDAVIRRRLQQKVEFISKDLSSIIDASDTELEQYLAANIEEYRGESTYSFIQVYLDPTKHQQPFQLAQQWLAGMDSIKPDGDATMLPSVILAKSQRVISSIFGDELAAYVANAKPDLWLGPVASSFGLHLIYISENQHQPVPSLDKVRDKVSRDWAFEQEKKIKNTMDENLLKKYNITVEHVNYATN